jgi:hypothetical protein
VKKKMPITGVKKTCRRIDSQRLAAISENEALWFNVTCSSFFV